MEIDLDRQQIAAKFWKQKAKGFSNEKFFGGLRKDVQEAILSKVKKKRFYKEGPSALNFSHEDESDDDEGSTVCTIQKVQEDAKLEDDGEEIAAVYDIEVEDEGKPSTFKVEETQELFWAHVCSECKIEMEGVQGTLKALIDSGSEVNLMSKDLYDVGQWMMDRDITWKVNGINSSKNSLWGACSEVKIKVGNVTEPINILVNENLPYPIILGQPFITQMRMETKVLDDGTHMAKLKSQNGLRIVQFLIV